MKTKKFGLYTAVSLVVANMIGTGVFTSLGFQVADINSGFAIVALWLLGGVAALFGALSYAELGATMPRSGGEYFYLSKIYHPGFGFLAGWVSFLVGFAAPVAAASMGLGMYMSVSLNLTEVLPGFLGEHPSKIIAAVVIILLTAMHAIDKKAGAAFQNIFTTLKILIVIVLVAIGFIYGDASIADFALDDNAISDMMSPAFAISLYFVSYSYSGWNAAAYIAGEIENPQRNIPLSLILGTSIVTVLYVLLNYVFMLVIPIPEMAGQLEIGYIFANKIWGTGIGNIMGMIIAVLLLSSVSSMIITGPRVTQVIGEDYSFFKWFSTKTKKDIPQRAIIIQSMISLVYVVTATFEQVITYIGFTLNLFTLFTVIGVLVYRKTHPNVKRPYKTFGYPVVPIIFILIGLWLAIYGVIFRPEESIAGLITTLSGLIVYRFANKKQQQNIVS